MPSDGRAPAWAPPLFAVQFLTRLPVPPLARLTSEQASNGLARAMGWLPLVGSGLGLITALVFVAAAQFWPPLVAALIAVSVEALLTGAFHEDAVADFCDAFGGSATGDEARRIMKDSRIGSYGALGLGSAVGLRVAGVATLPPDLAVAAIVGAAAGGRLCAVLLAAVSPPATAGLAARVGDLPLRRVLLAAFASLPGLALIGFLRPSVLIASSAACFVFLWWLARFLRRRIGGFTGDCLGFAAYVGQLFVILAAASR